ncbi:MAG: molybdenum cofactor guanylyltransferase [Candidatus Obscuribacterales bacterium]|nr:molybdenum cofactor guanylyltransferase [Candidatus Obscuribacterales bacterium]
MHQLLPTRQKNKWEGPSHGHHPDILSTPREQLPMPMSGIILCGGKSSRMGREKAFLPYAGKTLIEYRLDCMQELFAEVFLVTNNPDAFEHLSANVVKDIIPNRGPLAGILSGLLVSHYEQSFVIPCDTPLLDKQLIRQMSAKRHDLDLLIYGDEGQLEPLIGIYSKRCVDSLEKALFEEQKDSVDFVGDMNMQVFSPPKSAHKGPGLPAHFNIDTPQDYGKLFI